MDLGQKYDSERGGGNMKLIYTTASMSHSCYCPGKEKYHSNFTNFLIFVWPQNNIYFKYKNRKCFQENMRVGGSAPVGS